MSDNDTDFYGEAIYHDVWVRGMDTILWIVIQSCGTFLLLLIPQLVEECQHVTLIERLIVTNFRHQLLANIVYVNVDQFRFWFGPLPWVVCTLRLWNPMYLICNA